MEFLKKVFTPLFLACLVTCLIADANQGWVAGAYYVVSAALFIADIIDCIKGE